MAFLGLSPPAKKIMKQKPMLKVCYALLPCLAASVYFFGWRSLLLLALITLFGFMTEAFFTWREGKPVTMAVLVTCLIFHLSLPPSIPIYMALIGIVAAVAFGKMIFGGFGKNLFNPAMVGRCFIYINFPFAMTGQFVEPWWGGAAGLLGWTPGLDAITRATPLMAIRNGGQVEWLSLFWGNVSGSMGETSAILILLGRALAGVSENRLLASGQLLPGWRAHNERHPVSGRSAQRSPSLDRHGGRIVFVRYIFHCDRTGFRAQKETGPMGLRLHNRGAGDALAHLQQLCRGHDVLGADPERLRPLAGPGGGQP